MYALNCKFTIHLATNQLSSPCVLGRKMEQCIQKYLYRCLSISLSHCPLYILESLCMSLKVFSIYLPQHKFSEEVLPFTYIRNEGPLLARQSHPKLIKANKSRRVITTYINQQNYIITWFHGSLIISHLGNQFIHRLILWLETFY